MQLKIESDNYLQINRSNGEELHTSILWDGIMGEPSRVSGEARDPYNGEAYSTGATGALCNTGGRQNSAREKLQEKTPDPLPSCSLAPSLPHSYSSAPWHRREGKEGGGEWA